MDLTFGVCYLVHLTLWAGNNLTYLKLWAGHGLKENIWQLFIGKFGGVSDPNSYFPIAYLNTGCSIFRYRFCKW